MILTWSINVFLTLDQKVLQFLFRHFLPAGSQQTKSQGDLWHLGAAHHAIKRWPDLSPFAFLADCCGTRRCCSQPEGHAMYWIFLCYRPTEKYLEMHSKICHKRRKYFTQYSKWHKVETSTVFPSRDLQLGSPLTADPDCLTHTWLNHSFLPSRESRGRWRELHKFLLE